MVENITGHPPKNEPLKIDDSKPLVIKDVEGPTRWNKFTKSFTEQGKLQRDLEKSKLQTAKKDVEKHVKRVHKKEFKPKVENEDVKLEHLFKNLYKRFQKKWKHLPKEAFEMLTRKGVYPYTYMDNFDKFKETKYSIQTIWSNK